MGAGAALAAGGKTRAAPLDIVVIGAGLGGLSAACHLAGRGHRVTVLERDAVPGGRAGVWEQDGFRFDTGPTVLTMRGILAATFAAAGAELDDHLSLVRLDPMYRAVFAGEGSISVRPDHEAMVEEIRTTCGPADADAFARFCRWLGELYRIEAPSFIDRNFDSPLDLVRPLRPALALVGAGGFRRVAAVVASYFHDSRLQKLFSFQAMYAGLSPFEALAIYCVITYMDTVEGVWFPMGGLHKVAGGLATAAEKAGAVIAYGTEVDHVVRRPGAGGAVTGVRLADGSTIAADAVVANPDLPVAYRALLPGVRPPRAVRHGRYSPSAAVWLAGARGSAPAGAAHHNIHFGAEWRSAFDAVIRDGEVMPDPSMLVTVPTVTDPGLAPPGATCIYALEPVPNLDGKVDWRASGNAFFTRLQTSVADHGYPLDVAVQRRIDPTEWARQGMERGTPFSLAHTFRQTGPFRPSNVERSVPGLVFAGSGTQPGVGVPMVLLSGKLAAERVEQYGREGKP